jgi:hypothetical protein
MAVSGIAASGRGRDSMSEKKMKKILLFSITAIAIAVAYSTAWAQAEDGTYDAKVTTDSGTYHVPVEVEDGEVTRVDWPNGGRMRVRSGDLDDGEASGHDEDFNSVKVEIDDPSYEEKPDGE